MTAKQPDSKKKKTLAVLLLLFISLTIALLMSEIFFRFYWPYKSVYTSDDELGYKPKPNFEGTYKSPEGKWSFQTNSEGFVDQNPKEEKPKGTRRVFIVGDSFVEGLYTQRENHFTTLLQNKLNEKTSAGKVEVISYGTSSWGTDNEYKYIITQALRYSPDVVVLAYYQNDLGNVANSRLFRIENGKATPTRMRGTMLGGLIKKAIIKCSFHSYMCSYFQLHATSYSFLRAFLYRLGFSVSNNATTISADFNKHPFVKTPPNGTENIIEDAWEKTGLLIEAINDAVKEKGAKLVLAYVPSRWEVEAEQHASFLQTYGLAENETDMGIFRKKLQQISNENKIAFLDPTQAFTENGKSKVRLYQSFVHFTEEGDKLFANALYDGLTNSGYLSLNLSEKNEGS